MRKTRSWKHTTKNRKQYGNRDGERAVWKEIMLNNEMYLVELDDEEE